MWWWQWRWRWRRRWRFFLHVVAWTCLDVVVVVVVVVVLLRWSRSEELKVVWCNTTLVLGSVLWGPLVHRVHDFIFFKKLF